MFNGSLMSRSCGLMHTGSGPPPKSGEVETGMPGITGLAAALELENLVAGAPKAEEESREAPKLKLERKRLLRARIRRLSS